MIVRETLRIALFTYSTKPRGSVVHTVELAEALQDLGQQVCVYALDKDDTGFYRPLRCPYKLVSAQPVMGGIDALIEQRIQEFVNYLSKRSLTYDCYHAQDCISANALDSLKQNKQIPHFIRTVHHIEDFNSPYLQECQEKSIRHPDMRLCVSARWQVELREKYQIEAPRVTNGVNSQRFFPSRDGSDALKSQLGLDGWPVYLTIGGIEPRKNSLVLLQAFAKVLAQYPQAQLVIAGGATLFDYQAYREEFFALAQSAGVQIGKSLILPGAIADSQLPVLYRVSNAFVFPSIKEGWGLVVLEAMASGLPVITSNEPPFTEFLSDAADALLVNPHRVDAIALAMKAAIQPEIAQRLSRQGLEVSTRYTWEQSANLHLTHYRQLLQTHIN